MKILYCEDDFSMARMVQKLLRESGHDIDYVSNGVDGLDKATKNYYDLIIADNRMPGMYGCNMIRMAREQGINTPAILTSDDVVKDEDAKMFSYVLKKFGCTIDGRLEDILIKMEGKNE